MKKLALVVPVGLWTAAAHASAAADSLKTQMTSLTDDVTTTIGPAAIGLAVAIATVVVGRAFIKKFFKA